MLADELKKGDRVIVTYTPIVSDILEKCTSIRLGDIGTYVHHGHVYKRILWVRFDKNSDKIPIYDHCLRKLYSPQRQMFFDFMYEKS